MIRVYLHLICVCVCLCTFVCLASLSLSRSCSRSRSLSRSHSCHSRMLIPFLPFPIFFLLWNPFLCPSPSLSLLLFHLSFRLSVLFVILLCSPLFVVIPLPPFLYTFPLACIFLCVFGVFLSIVSPTHYHLLLLHSP